MASCIPNPRRWQRFEARIRAVATCRGEQLRVETLDIGQGGCALLMPRVVTPGDAIRIRFSCDSVLTELAVVGTIAWCATEGRCRAGISFDARAHERVGLWLIKYLRHNPAVTARTVPLPPLLDAAARVSVTPRAGSPLRVLPFTPAERAVLDRALGGATVGELVARDEEATSRRAAAIFALLAKGALAVEQPS